MDIKNFKTDLFERFGTNDILLKGLCGIIFTRF